MPASFHFRAVNADGKVRNGTLTAENDKEVARELRKQGLTPVYVGLEQQKNFELELPDLGGGRKKDVLFFTTELTTLLNSGIPVDRALQITTELTEKPQFRMVVLDVLRVLKGGRTLADSLATHPKYFSELYVNMVRAGEASGSLGVVFERLAEFEKTRDELRGYIISSMVYPILLSLVGVGSVLILMNFVVPRFAQVFEQGNIPMPTPTRVMIEASRYTQAYGPVALGVLAVAVIAFQAYIRTKEGRLWWDGLRLRIPLLGDVLRKAETARFARAMGTLISNSVPLVQSLSIAGAILNNKRISNSLGLVAQGVKRGEGISVPLKRTGEFPPLASHLLSVGEETGKLDTMFLRMADVYEADTRAAIRRFTSLFEPIIILVMGVIIGSLVISLLLAITSINDVAI
ncbi:MAG TPA: type II secretion system F family protein [Bryobacteraceae bacterium]|nr:type II secretion system F family protein [Bryobacteraceae bacterium]